jgi:hypothetical protein
MTNGGSRNDDAHSITSGSFYIKTPFALFNAQDGLVLGQFSRSTVRIDPSDELNALVRAETVSLIYARHSNQIRHATLQELGLNCFGL